MSPQPRELAALLVQAAAEIDGGRPLIAAALYREILARPDLAVLQRTQALDGLAEAQIALADYAAAEISLGDLAAQTTDPAARGSARARQAACAAEQGEWDRSWQAAQAPLAQAEQIPIDLALELAARAALALFQLDRIDQADAVLIQAGQWHKERVQDGGERLRTRYFAAMIRFYRAAVQHRKFQQQTLEGDTKALAQAFSAKVGHFDAAQEHYRLAIKIGHARWVSAASFQMGVLAEELYDALAVVPIPAALPVQLHEDYYRELSKRLAPLVERAAKTFQRSIETAERFGYDDEFIAQSRVHLARLQRLALNQPSSSAGPLPRLALDGGADREGEGQVSEVHDRESSLGAAVPDRQSELFVPQPTPL